MTVLPFEKPHKKVRLVVPPDKAREKMLEALLEAVIRLETQPDFVGWCLVGLTSDGARLADYNVWSSGLSQLSKQVRREAAFLTKQVHQEE